MAITKLNSLAIPPNTIVESDLSYPLTNFSSTGIDDNASSTAVTIDGSQNVGIGTAPNYKLDVVGGIRATNTSGSTIIANRTSNPGSFELQYDGTQTGQFSALSGGGIITYVGSVPSEAMRIDSSGNLLVGKTSTDVTVVGTELRANGLTWHTTNGIECLGLNRLTSDGKMLDFRKDGTTVGSIGVVASDNIYLAGNSGHAGIGFGSIAVYPVSSTGATKDNQLDLGDPSGRWDDIYATNATIQTSDANEKQDIETLSEAETRVAVAAKALLRKFRWKSAVEEKGDEARIHFGVIAQDLKAAFEAEGLDAGRYGMFIHSTWTDEETGEERSRMGVRYSELLAFIIAAI